jgi:citrate synthase
LRIAAGEAGAAKRDEIVARLPGVQERVREAGDALLAAVREVDALAAAYAWLAAPDRPHTPPMNRVRVQGQTFSAEAAIRGIVGRAYRIEERKPEAETSDTDVAREPQRAGQHA